jgi:hypothetical protein
MRMLTNDERDSFVEVPESSGEATLSEITNPGHERVVERCEDATRREPLLFDPTQFFVLLRHPRVHELTEQDLDALLSRRVDHSGEPITPSG